MKECSGSGAAGGEDDGAIVRDLLGRVGAGVEIGVKLDAEVVGRSTFLPALWPFDEKDAVGGFFVEEKVGYFGVGEAVEIGVEEGQAPLGVLGEQDEAGAAHEGRGAEAAAEALGEDGLAGAELTGEENDVAALQHTSKALAKRGGLLGGVGGGQPGWQRVTYGALGMSLLGGRHVGRSICRDGRRLARLEGGTMREPVRVLSALPMSESTQAELRAVEGVEVRVLGREARRLFRSARAKVEDGAEAEIREALAESVALFALGFDHSWLADGGSLRWIQLASAGADQAVSKPLPPGVVLTNAGDLYATPVAEWVLAFLLMHAKEMPFFLARQAEAAWSRKDALATLRGSTVAIVGLGKIGGETARLCRAFGARVLGSTRSGDAVERGQHCDALFSTADLNAMVSQADYVVLAVPLTEETRGFFDNSALSAMKPEGVLVNIARGAVVDQGAMVAALEAGRIAAVYTDVMVPEPLPDGDPLWSVPNLYITPHNSGSFDDWMTVAATVLESNLRRFVAGEPLENVVDQELGY